MTYFQSDYCTEHTESRVVFASPKRLRIASFVMMGCFILLAISCFGSGIYCAVIHAPKVEPAELGWMGLFWLVPAALSGIDTGINRVAFDLVRRRYDRTLYRPFLGGGTDFSSLGNRFQRTSTSGTMKDVAGVRVLARSVGKHNTKYYGMQIQWINNAEPPMPIGVFTDRRAARKEANDAAEALSLPLLEIDEGSQPILHYTK